MCAFHHLRQRDSLFEGERMGQGVCVSRLIKWCASKLKTQKFRELGVLFSDGGIGKVDEVVLKEWMLENAIRVRF